MTAVNTLTDYNSLDVSWLNGNYSNGAISTSYQTVAIKDFWSNNPDTELFAQGEEADRIINEIYDIWIKYGCDVEQAIDAYRSLYGY